MVNIKVAVRIRPLSQRELDQREEVVVRKENKSVVVTNPKIPERQDGDSRQRTRRFSVDFCYDAEDPEGSSQEAVYREIGSEVLDSMFEGYNACVLAYGHSASGKTYTIMGVEDDPGLTPRLCEGLFRRVKERPSDGSIRVEVAASFLEIYNEKVKDLLGSEETGANPGSFSLRVREHPKLGPYVQGLSEHLVTDEGALLGLLATGNRKRSTAATENNVHSSRSHAVFTIHFRQSDGEKCETEKWSKVHLVDLAGSLPEVSRQESPPNERATSAQSKARLQEGANINKSLVTLGNVISALAESLETSAAGKEHPPLRSWHPFVPYRDSVLTWLLKDTLGGNSNTIMIATISPAGGCLGETVNTLRYAKRTKRIVNQAIVNEDPKVRTIRELKREIARLKGLLVSFQSVTGEGSSEDIWEGWADEEEMMRRSARSRGGGVEGGGRVGEGLGGCVLGRSAASAKGPGVETNDEKESVVNGSANDTFSHESQVFSDSLESLGSVFGRGGRARDAEPEAPPGGGRGEFGSGENVRRKDSPGMLHRSRPDLIRGISARFKERLPSTSSQSCTDVSNLSQSTSENSLNSSGSVEVQTGESRSGQGAPARSPTDGKGEREGVETRKDADGGPAPRRDKRSEIVEAVTTRLYAVQKKPDHRMKPVGETEESKLCKRARMKLFDLSRKLAMRRRTKRTVDTDTQTDSMTGTIRVKEKCVETDPGRGPEDERSRDDGGGCLVTFRGPGRQESATQTTSEEKSDKSANTSPIELSQDGEESFSDDSLDLEDERRGCGEDVSGFPEDASTNGRGRSEVAKYLRYFQGEKEGGTGGCLLNGLPLSVLTDAKGHPEQRGFVYASVHPSNGSLSSKKDENMSSDSSFTSAEGPEFVSSSEASSEDFIFYENPKEKDPEVGATVTRDRELYTITENSEQSDPSDAFSPVQSQSYSLDGTEGDGTGQKRGESPGRRSRVDRIGDEEGSEEPEGGGRDRGEAPGGTFGGVAKHERGSKRRLESEASGSGSFSPSGEGWKRGEQMGRGCEGRCWGKDAAGRKNQNGDVRGEGRKMNWADWQPNTEKQYLNLNISNSSRAPFSIDTHLFGREWKDQSGDAMFTSADSVTLVFMGPAKPKSSVLMEIIRRSLGRDSSSSETSSGQRKSKSRGVQCDASLVRSVSVDTAMIALSRIARNQERSPEIGRTTSLGELDPVEVRTSQKGKNHKETSCQCDMDPDYSNQKKKSALKCSVGTETVTCEDAETDAARQKKPETAERPKKSVSWLGETRYDVEPPSRSSEGAPDEWEGPRAHGEIPDTGSPPADVEPSVGDSRDDLTTFLKEAIHLLRKINSSPSRHEGVPEETGQEPEPDRHRHAEENEKGMLKRTKKVEMPRRSKAEGWLEREENGRLRAGGGGGGLGVGEGDGSWVTSTWPRRRAATGKPPTGLRGRLGRSAVAGRSESLHSSGLLECSRSGRSGGSSWNCSRWPLGLSGTNWCFEESETRHQNGRGHYSDEAKWEKDVHAGGRTSPRVSLGKLNFESLLEAETDLENCCRRLELAVEQDEARERNLENRKALHECDGQETGLWYERWNGEEESRSNRKRAREGIKRRKAGECTGRCTCRPSAKDPCKHLFTKGCQSSFELDSFGPGSNHCHQFCIFCRKKDAELYSSALNLNSECLSGVCRLNYYGYCPCSSVRLGHVASSPRAYMQHLLTLRRQIVGRNKTAQPNLRPLRGHCGNTHVLPYFSPS